MTAHAQNHVLQCNIDKVQVTTIMSRKIYFAGSIRAGRNDADLYAKIVAMLRQYGTVLTEHVGDPNMTEKGQLLVIVHK